MIRASIGRALLWLLHAVEPDLLPTRLYLREDEALAEAIVVQRPRPVSLSDLIDAWSRPTAASEKRGEYSSTRRVAAIARIRGELTRQERALWAVAAGSPDIGSSFPARGLAEMVMKDVRAVRERVRRFEPRIRRSK